MPSVAARVLWKAFAAGGAVLGLFGAIALARRDQTPPSSAKRVALIGDSYAVGLGPELEKLLPTLRGEAYSGTNTGQWANSLGNGRWGGWLADFRPTDVLVALGVNDGGVPNLENYRRIVQTLQGLGARVVWIEPPAAVNTPAVRSVIASLGVPTIRATTIPLAADGLHPSNYRKWAQDVAGAYGA